MEPEQRIVVARGNRSFNLKLSAINEPNLIKIFKLMPNTIFLTSENGNLVFPSEETGAFEPDDMVDVARFDIGGEDLPTTIATPPTVPGPSGTFRFSGMEMPGTVPVPTAPRRPPQTAVHRCGVYIGTVERGQMCPFDGKRILEYTAAEANLDSIRAKAKVAMSCQEEIVLCDGQGVIILESVATSKPEFWNKPARKIVAMTVSHYDELQRAKRRRTSGFAEGVRSKIDGVVEAAEGLGAVAESLRNLITYVNSNKVETYTLNEEQRARIKATLKCMVCHDLMRNPMLCPPCRTFIGCQSCTEEVVRQNDDTCPHCRRPNLSDRLVQPLGLEDIFAVHRDNIRD